MPRSTRIAQWRARREKRTRHSGRFLLRAGCLVALLLLAPLGAILLAGGVGTAVAAVYLNQSLPSISQLENLPQESLIPAEGSKIYAWGSAKSDGSRDPILIYEVTDPLGEARPWLTLEQMPHSLIDATLAAASAAANAEPALAQRLISNDRATAYLARRLVEDTLLGDRQPVAHTETRSNAYRYQLDAFILARQAAQTYSQAQILAWTLNSSYYGNLAYGVEAAARVYFNKSAAALTLAEAALLAAVPLAPALNPLDDPVAAKERQIAVLEAMVSAGAISRAQSAAAQFVPIVTASDSAPRFDIIAPHFALYARQQLEQMFGPERVLRDGLRVYTTLDLTMQRQAECVARAHLARLAGQVGELLPADERAACTALSFLSPLSSSAVGVNRNASNAAVVVLDPTSGEIRALVGSLNYWDGRINGSLNMATDGLHQPGSTLKPFIYLTALSQGYNAATMVLDVATDFGTPYDGRSYVPQNNDGQFHGPMRLRQALGNDYNVPAVQVMSWVGAPSVLRTAQSLGVTTLPDAGSSNPLSLPLGGGQVRLLDMAYAYGVLANMGDMVGQPGQQNGTLPDLRPLNPVAIVRVEDREGNVLYAYDQPEQREILPPQLAFLLNDLLSDRSARCAAFGCPNVLELPNNRPAAVQTGSTNDFRDSWTIGYTPQLVTAVWVGNTDNSPMPGLSGSEGAAPIWQALMSWALQEEPVQLWLPPPGLVERPVCDISGLLPTPICPTVSEWFILGTEPVVFDTMFQEIAINRENGRLATLSTPPELIERKIFRIYPEAAAAWAQENGIEQPPTEYDTLDVSPGSGDVAILSPHPFAYVQGQVIISGTVNLDDLAYYRLAYFAGLTPANIRALGSDVPQRVVEDQLGVWDVENLQGLYTLLLTAVRQDGRFVEVSVPLTVDNVPPTVEMTAPLPNQQFFSDERWVLLQATASDNLAVAHVAFYVDEEERPFTVSTEPPYSARWPIRAAGCHTFRAVAVDGAGNETEGTAVPICLIARP